MKNKQSQNAKHQHRLDAISSMLKEMRFSEGLRQTDLSEYGISQRQVQRAEGGMLTLNSLFNLIDFYRISLHEFFYEIE
jgi:hypothetical protein